MKVSGSVIYRMFPIKNIQNQWNKCTVMHANEFSSKFPLFSITYNVSYAETQLTDRRVNREIYIFL